jgi:hypothetical protein
VDLRNDANLSAAVVVDRLDQRSSSLLWVSLHRESRQAVGGGCWTAVWAQWRRWRANGVWARAMERLAAIVRVLHDREPVPSMVMVDAQTVKGGRYGPTFHEAGGMTGSTTAGSNMSKADSSYLAATRSSK